MTETHERVVRAAELAAVAVQCGVPTCGAELRLDFRQKSHRNRLIDDARLTCQICHTELDALVRQELRQLAVWYETAALAPALLTFRIPEEP